MEISSTKRKYLFENLLKQYLPPESDDENEDNDKDVDD